MMIMVLILVLQKDDAEKVIFDALVARIVEISTKEPVIARKGCSRRF